MSVAISRVNRFLKEAGVKDFVFVGGATIGLYLNDAAAPALRFTTDVDVVTPVLRLSDYYDLESALRAAGHSQPLDSPVICRWQVGQDLVDVLPVSDVLGFTNRWFGSVIEHAIQIDLPDGQVASIAAPAYLLATKLEAFRQRGRSDILMSHDLDDIVILIDGREDLVSEVAESDADVRAFISESVGWLLDNSEFHDTLAGRLEPDSASQARSSLILSRMQALREL